MKPILKQPVTPNSIKVEMTEGCNLACKMCGINGIREKPGGPFKYLTVESAVRIADLIRESGWNPRIEFTLRGEPLMNPNREDIVSAFRARLPKIHLMVTTNAIPLLRGPGVHANINKLFEAGLNLLLVDDYKPSQKATALVRTYKERPVTGYGNVPGIEKGPSPYHRVKATEQRVVIIEDFETASKQERTIRAKRTNNHCGAGGPGLVEPLSKRCAHPFREMVIRWDGRLALCCNDWRDLLWMNHVWDYPSLMAAWDNPVLQAARRKLYHRDRGMKPCDVCSERTYRDGFLPDKSGQFRLAEPTVVDENILHTALAHGPATTPVIRPWEIKPAV